MDASGQLVNSYEDFAQPWAQLSTLTARELFAAQQISASTTAQARLLWRNDVDETCRVKRIVEYGPPEIVELYDIEGVIADQDTNRRYMTLLLAKRTSEGWRRGAA